MRRTGRLPCTGLCLLIYLSCSPRYIDPETADLRIGNIAEKISSYHSGIRTCRRLFTFKARKGVGSLNGEGIFLYGGESRYRLEVWDAMGNLLVHYIENDVGRELDLPEDALGVFLIEKNDHAIGERGFTVEEIKCISRSSFAFPLNDPVISARSPGFIISETVDLDGTIQKEYEFDPHTGMPLRYVVLSHGKPVRRARFDDPVENSGMTRPSRIELVDGDHDTSITIDITQESLNEDIPESLFLLNPRE